MDINRATQDGMEASLLEHGRLRDMFNVSSKESVDNIVNFIMGEIVATYFNATLITHGHPQYEDVGTVQGKMRLNMTKAKNPRMIPDLRVFANKRNLSQVWDHFYTFNFRTIEMPTLVPKNHRNFNFAYCSVPHRKSDSSWKFSIFTDPFDIWTWWVLVALVILVSILLARSSGKGYFPSLLSTLAVLLDNEMGHFRSNLFVLWLFITRLIFDFYSGEITSQVISPPQEFKLTYFTDIKKYNYSIVYGHEFVSKLVGATLQNYLTRNFTSQNLHDLSELVKNSEVHYDKTDEFIPAFLDENRKVVTFMGWSHAIWAATKASQTIAKYTQFVKRKNKKLEKKPQKCYIGKELFPAGEIFFAFTPPGSNQMARMFQRLQASGVVNRWNRELHSMVHSRRVQDRAKVVGPTLLAEEREEFMVLRMVGRIATIFLLWIFCLLVSSVSFVFERFYFLIRVRKDNIKNISSVHISDNDNM